MDDVPVYDLPWMLQAARHSPDDQRSYRLIARTLVTFLQDNRLLNRTDFPHLGDLPDDTQVMESDLTEEGRRLFHAQIIDKWFAAGDRSGNYRNTGVLQKGLEKLRDVDE